MTTDTPTPPDELPLAELEAINAYFVVLPEVPADDPPGVWAPLAEALADDEAVDRLIDRSGERLGTDNRMVAASILHQGWGARLTSAWAACVVLRGWAPDLSVERIWRRTDYPGGAAPIALTELVRLDPEAAWASLYQGHLDVVGAALRRRVNLGRRLLAGNTASCVAGTAGTMERQGVITARNLLAQSWSWPTDLAACGTFESLDPPSFRRTTCCLYCKIPGKGRCGDCSLDRSAP